jgi:hypothetical protein
VTGARGGLTVALLALGAFVAGCGEKEEDLGTATGTIATEPTSEIAGDWAGQLTQKGLAPFQVAVRIDPSGTGRVAYTGINCGGSWTSKGTLESQPPQYLFEERIGKGAGGTCKGIGEVKIAPRGETLGYVFSGGGVTSRGLLSRTDAAGLRPVFKQAGVASPG